MFNIFEFLPLFAGYLLATLLVSSPRDRGSYWRSLMVLVAIGISCSLIAGEWTAGVTSALPAVLWDSGEGALGFTFGYIAITSRCGNRVA